MIPQYQWRAWEAFVCFGEKPEFTKAECESIIHLARTLRPEPARTGGTPAGEAADPKIRASEIRWMKRTKQSKWIFERLAGVCNKTCPSWYPFHLSGFNEPLQITHYFGSEGGHYDWHQDFGPAAQSTRKLSLVALLNDRAEFKGGELEIMSVLGKEKAVRPFGNLLQQGTVIAFPSWDHHRVTPVTEGERWSLVTWVHGHPFV
jgi:PKHD-type hydroxylase